MELKDLKPIKDQLEKTLQFNAAAEEAIENSGVAIRKLEYQIRLLQSQLERLEEKYSNDQQDQIR